jgi:hypothetical protein
MNEAPGPDLVEVRIEQLPLEVYRSAAEHSDELLREFALIKERDVDEGRSVPRRLLALVAELGERFSAFSTEQTTQLESALERGESVLDLVYRVPPEARQATIELDAMLDEADRFCREGKELLTLATPPAALAFRRWFLEEFVRQIDGEPPLPWPDYCRREGLAVEDGGS